MTRKPKSAAYDVGYGKPPPHSRFQPGRSGNPRGRPKGRRNLITELEEALAQKVLVTDNGRKRSMSKLQLIVHSTTNKAAKGDLKAVSAVLSLIDRLGLAAAAPEEATVGLVPDDQAIVAEFLLANGVGETPQTEGSP